MTMIAKEARKGQMVRQDCANDLTSIAYERICAGMGLCRDHNWPVISACIGLGFRSSLANNATVKKVETLKNCFIGSLAPLWL